MANWLLMIGDSIAALSFVIVINKCSSESDLCSPGYCYKISNVCTSYNVLFSYFQNSHV